MKKAILFFAMLLSVIAASAKDIKTVVFTTNPIMHCANCENKIKTNLRFAKGVKDIQTNVAEQRVTVAYDATKTDAAKLQQAFTKFGYEAKVVAGGTQKPACAGKKDGCKAGDGACGAGKKMSCCQEKKDGADKQCCGGCKDKAAKQEGCGGCKQK